MLGVLGLVDREEQSELVARGGGNVRVLGSVEGLAQVERAGELVRGEARRVNDVHLTSLPVGC